MSYDVAVIDESTAQSQSVAARTLSFLEEQVSVRELIRRRVYEECSEFNARQGEVFQGLVTPEGSERTLNGARVGAGRSLDWQEQYARALEAFGRLGFVVLVDDRQVEDLDEVIDLHLDRPLEAIFLKLVPLVGG